MSKWTRETPTTEGWWWAAFRLPREKEYRVKPVEIWMSTEEHGLMMSGIVASAMPVKIFRHYDVLWMPLATPTPPVYKSSPRKPV